MSDLFDILETVAKRLGKRTKLCNCFDQNVCNIKVDDRWHPIATSGYPFSRELRSEFNGRRIELMASPEFLRCRVKGALKTIPWSVGQPGRISFIDKQRAWLQVGELRWPVFTRKNEDAMQALRPSLDRPVLTSAVETLLRNPSESLHFFTGAVVLYFQPKTADAAIEAVSTLAGLLEKFSPEADSIDFNALPERLQVLIPHIRRWAVSDDSERADLLQEASRSDLEDLVQTVEVHFEKINQYLDSFGKSGPTEPAALALQTLGECTVEAQLELRGRG